MNDIHSSFSLFVTAACFISSIHAAEPEKPSFDLGTPQGRAAYIAYQWNKDRAAAKLAIQMWGLKKPKENTSDQNVFLESDMPSDQALADFGVLIGIQ